VYLTKQNNENRLDLRDAIRFTNVIGIVVVDDGIVDVFTIVGTVVVAIG